MEEAVEHGGDGGGVAKQLAPVFDGPVRGEHGAGPLVAAHDDFEQFLGGGGRELAHAEVVDDQQRDGARSSMCSLRVPSSDGVGHFIEQDVGLAVEDAVALLDRGLADGLREVALARAGRAEEQDVFVAVDELAGGEVEDQPAIHLLVEVEVEGVEGLVGVAELRLAFVRRSSKRSPRRASSSGPGRRSGRWGRRFALRLTQTGLQHGGHAAQAQLLEGTLSSMRFILPLLGSVVDEIAVLDQLANERIDLAQRAAVRGTFEVAADEAVFLDAHFERGGAGFIDCGGAVLLGQESTPRMRRTPISPCWRWILDRARRSACRRGRARHSSWASERRSLGVYPRA